MFFPTAAMVPVASWPGGFFWLGGWVKGEGREADRGSGGTGKVSVGDKGLGKGRADFGEEFAFVVVQIRAADSAGCDLDLLVWLVVKVEVGT